jgi:hypothetical protein
MAGIHGPVRWWRRSPARRARARRPRARRSRGLPRMAGVGSDRSVRRSALPFGDRENGGARPRIKDLLTRSRAGGHRHPSGRYRPCAWRGANPTRAEGRLAAQWVPGALPIWRFRIRETASKALGTYCLWSHRRCGHASRPSEAPDDEVACRTGRLPRCSTAGLSRMVQMGCDLGRLRPPGNRRAGSLRARGSWVWGRRGRRTSCGAAPVPARFLRMGGAYRQRRRPLLVSIGLEEGR